MRLGDIIEIKHGYAFSGDHIIEEDNNVVLVTPGNFRIGGGFQEKKCKFFNGDLPSDYILNEGDFIVTMTDLSKTIDTLGYSAIVPKSKNRIYLHNQRIGLVHFKNDICDRGYIYWLMRTRDYQRTIANTSTGSTVHHTSPSKIYDYEFETPDKATQHRVASILFHSDSLIENYQQQIKLLEDSAQRLYKEWFIDLRFPGHKNTKIVDGVPEGWVKKTLDSFCNVFTGKKNANQGVSNGKYKFFTCGDTPLLINSYIYDGPAIIISGNGSYTGRTTFYKGKFDLYQRTYACIMKDMQDENLIYGLFEIVKCELTNKISGGTHGAAIPYIVMSDVTKFDFLYEENIMQRFSSIMHNILSESLSLLNQIRHLTEARDRLLPKLMNGEIEVKIQ